ncbi:CRISPR-associated endonuclease Cas1 [Propionicicella superfundia]|uniref:CRISPR-associated endonuclease Cas1 n=1 Tax=Propionicicella superfundia TaxID=348582 RepID=UPI0003F9F48A|nr:CRISPR-associated endonuclease Cas1 [Propionicicella superfundia]
MAARAFSVRSLNNAWQAVWANDRADGELSRSVARFSEDAPGGIEALADALTGGSYEPRPLVEVQIPRKGDEPRTLHIPSVPDRIVARAILDTATPFVDPELGHCAFAYRPGLGVADAVQAIARQREEGLGWVLRTDIDECFPTLPVDLAHRRLAALVDDDDLASVLTALSARPYRTATRALRAVTGLPQGCPLSPVLANLVLVDVDRALLDRGYAPVRYGDDIAIPCANEDDAWEAARVTSEAAERLDMSLGSDKTHAMSFTEGFVFLGEEFGPRYPPALDDYRAVEPDEKVLYAGLQGGRIRISQGRLLAQTKDDETVLDVPKRHVGRIVCFGSVGLSAGARSWALSHDVDVVFASRSGAYLGTMVSHEQRYRPARLRAQLDAVGSAQALAIGRAIIAAKVRKQEVVLQRANHPDLVDDVRDVVRHLAGLRRMLPDAGSAAELMGLEGAAAQAYFPMLGRLMPEELRFALRSRRPPEDVPNAALSFLYTVLLGECVTALHAAGLDPSIGVLHADQGNRPSLALDLMEEFRPHIVDSVVLRVARRGGLTVASGRSEPGRGVLLTKAGREAVLDAYETRMLTATRGALPGFAGSLRRHVLRQAQRLRAAIMDRGQAWTGLSWR